MVSIVFPPEFNVPIVKTLQSCVANNNLAGVSCKINGPNGIMATLSFPGGSSTNSFSFTVLNVQNPPSTEPTSRFQVQIYDTFGMLVNDNDQNLVNFYAKMAFGMQFKSISIFN